MGQLVKLQDYISRYEQDIYRYQTQFVRLKKQQWSKLHAAFLAGELYEMLQDDEEDDWITEKPTFIEKLKSAVKRKVSKEELVRIEDVQIDTQEDEFQMQLSIIPRTEEDLKVAFLNRLFDFQMKWATTTIRERSIVDPSFYQDEQLKFFLQRFPDTFLVLFQPVLQLKKAPVETDTIILTPTATWCVSFLEEDEDAVFIGSDDKFWLEKHHHHPDKKILNPHISLKRTETIVRNIYDLYGVELPIKKAIISRTGYIDYPIVSHDLHLLDKRSFPQWFQSMRNLSSPLKSQQLKGAEALLNYCQTTSTMRLEWNDPIEFSDEAETETK